MPKSLIRVFIDCCVTLLLISAASFYNIPPASAQGTARQNNDYCRATGTVRIFLIDVTTPYDRIDKEAISATIRRVLLGAAEGDRILIRTITDSFTNSERLIERCVPGCDAEGIRRLSCNDGLIRIDRDKVRADVVEALSARLNVFTELKFSDIIRTIDRSAREDLGAAQKAQIFIYSDMIENSDYLVTKSFYYYSNDFLIAGLKKLGFIPDFKGARISVAGVGRSDAADRHPLSLNEMTKVSGFWKAYFAAANAGDTFIGQSLPTP